MTDQEQINDLACVLDKAKIDAIGTIGSLNNGFGQWYAKAVYNAGYRKIPNGEVLIPSEERFEKEIEKLKIQLEQSNAGIVNCGGCWLIEQQAVKEFAEKLKQYIKQNEVQTKFFGGKCFINEEIIDELLKEYEK